MTPNKHPCEDDLALLAGGETGRLKQLLLDRHVRVCADCQDKVAEYRDLRADLADAETPEVNWTLLAAEMRANIRLGLEAGACVRTPAVSGRRFSLAAMRINWLGWAVTTPGLAIAFTSVVLLIVSGFFLRDLRLGPQAGVVPGAVVPGAVVPADTTPVLQSTETGIEFRSGDNSLMLLNRSGDATNQTVSARGNIGSRVINGGSVTINNVYLQ
jgi:hypothetical protein